ncbi:RrF2 family transcriptional regulator [Halodurantibacterium flavum]|uniref:RrF2 family transcriptional regulator n=1 Tax=Halodurantibacterium flavum TaxID=1382802 RepID=A0ABW4S483_9RHOB
MKLTLRTDLALRVLMYCALNDGLARKHDIAAACGASVNHLGQVIHALGQAGFIRTARGRGGGIVLARPPARQAIGAVVRLFEARGPDDCFGDCNRPCPLIADCRLRPVLSEALEAFWGVLDSYTLADLTEGNGRLAGAMGIGAVAAPDHAGVNPAVALPLAQRRAAPQWARAAKARNLRMK